MEGEYREVWKLPYAVDFPPQPYGSSTRGLVT